MHYTNKIVISYIFVLISSVHANSNYWADDYEGDYPNDNTFVSNKSPSIHSSTKMTNVANQTTSLSSSLLIKALSNKNDYKTNSSIPHQTLSSSSSPLPTSSTSKRSSTSVIPKKNSMTSSTSSPYALVSYLVDQFNHYRNVDILSRIKQCNSNMKLHDICEIYSFDNHTYSLIRELSVEFQTLKDVYNSLVDQAIVQKLNKMCSPGQWCLGNISQADIRYTVQVIQQRGRSFCSMEKCTSRLTAQATACPLLVSQNISTPTLKLLPMFCALYEEQQSWTTDQCMSELVRFFHILYAFWPQLETCHHVIAAASGGCTSECLAFDTLLHNVENQCNGNPLFLSRVSTLTWYRLVHLKQLCLHENIVTNPPFISSVKEMISSSLFWYRLHQRPAYAFLFIIILSSIVISFSLCLYVMSKHDSNSDHRRIDDDYEYTRLHDSTFDLGASTEITNANSTSDRMINQSSFDLNGNHRLLENQRLLYAES